MISAAALKIAKALRLARRPRYRAALSTGVAAAIEHERMLRRVDFRSLIDVGANSGQFSLVAREAQPHSYIYAFEPLPDPCEKYRSLFADDRRVSVYNVALGSSRSFLDINVSRRDDSSSLLPISEIQSSSFPGTECAYSHRVSVQRGDEVLSRIQLRSPVLLKIDVQGYELEVLKGLSKILSSITYIYVELSTLEFYKGQPLAGEVISWLQENGFSLSSIDTLSRVKSGVGAQFDALFTAKRP